MIDAPGTASLDVERRDHPTRRFVLATSPFRIGRAPESELHVPDGHVSKQHAEIVREGSAFVLVDTGSRAGVMVNGQPVQRHSLTSGDTIELGASSPVRITFRLTKVERPNLLEMTMMSVVKDPAEGGMSRLARFFEFSHKLGGGFSLEEVLRDVVDLAIEVTGAERGMLIVRRPDDSLETKVARASGARSLPIDGLKVSETIVRKALAHGKPSTVDDVGQDTDLALAASIVSLELRSAVTLPLLQITASAGRDAPSVNVFGVIYLDSKRRRGGFDGFDLRILERLAQDASSVIENARLLGEAEEKRRIDREVKMAREVQAALMPEQFRSTTTFEVAGTCVPCHDLGGDYVDQFDLGGGRQALVVADVCGKGIAASLLAATLQGALAAEIGSERSLGEIVSRVNRVHCRLAPVGKFITMVVALLEPDGTLRIVNAGHCPVLHAHRNGVASIVTDGMALGLDEDANYRDATIRMSPGDTVLLYTDGIVECEGPGRELFGDNRLERLLEQERALSSLALLERVTHEVETFRRGVPVSDDLSVLVVRRR